MLSCSPARTPVDVISALYRAENSPPRGSLYGYHLTDSSIAEMPEEMLCALFGNGAYPAALDEAETGACYLSLTHPYEITIFYAKSREGAKKLAQMCLLRKDALLRAWEGKGYDDYLQNATVTVRGRWVMLSITRDRAEAERLFYRAV